MRFNENKKQNKTKSYFLHSQLVQETPSSAMMDQLKVTIGALKRQFLLRNLSSNTGHLDIKRQKLPEKCNISSGRFPNLDDTSLKT